MIKRTSKNNLKKNLRLTIYLCIRGGLSPAKICKKLNLKTNAIQYYLNNLKANGLIEKRGYGVWAIKKAWKEPQKSRQVTHKAMGSCNLRLLQDTVRGHAFMFTVKLPKLKNWDKRELFFKNKGLDFKPLNIAGGGQSFLFKDKRIWFTNKSIVIFEKSSYLAGSSGVAKNKAIFELRKLLIRLENIFNANFKVGGQYKFKVSRQHYALVKNALAKQYDDEGKRLNVYNENGLWFIIDNSFNLHEAETIHPKTADKDNLKVQNFFNGLKKFEDFTPEFVVNSIAGVSENQALYSKNIKTHIEAIELLGQGVEKQTLILNELKNLLKKKGRD